MNEKDARLVEIGEVEVGPRPTLTTIQVSESSGALAILPGPLQAPWKSREYWITRRPREAIVGVPPSLHVGSLYS